MYIKLEPKGVPAARSSDRRFDVTINEYTGVGKALYSVAYLDDVKMFLEIGTGNGGSARCIATGLKQTGGTLHTIDFKAIQSDMATIDDYDSCFNDLPVVFHQGRTVTDEKFNRGLKAYYNKYDTTSSDFVLEPLLKEHKFDAVFLDSSPPTQAAEFEMIMKLNSPKYMLMHEPDVKCPNILQMLRKSDGWVQLDSGRDKIGSTTNVLWSLHQNLALE